MSHRRHPHIAFIELCAVFLSFAYPAHAEQLAFSRQEAAEDYHYAVDFKGRKHAHSLHFSLPRTAVETAYARSPSLRGAKELTEKQAEELWREANSELDERVSLREVSFEEQVDEMAIQLSDALGRDGSLSVTWNDDDFTIRTIPPTGSFSKAEAARIEAALKHSMGQLSRYADSLRANQETQMKADVRRTEEELQTGTDAIASRALVDGLLKKVPGGNAVTVDYLSAVKLSISSMHPLAAAVAEAVPRTARARLETALSFFQAIPYDSFSGRTVGPDMGFLLPAASINENRGDCDTKSVALAAVLASLLPEHQVIMIVLPGHAILGIDFPVYSDDASISHEGKGFVLLEPAGPGQYPIGQLCEESLTALEGGRIEQIIPLLPGIRR